MRGINHVILFGHLGASPELRTTRSGKSVCELSLATNRRVKTDDGFKDDTTWHKVTLWERDAELACRLLAKGSAVGIEGRLQTDSWLDKTTGQRRYKTYVVGHRMHLVGRASDAPRPPANSSVPHAQVSEEEIPF